jgi:hypothetical protein
LGIPQRKSTKFAIIFLQANCPSECIKIIEDPQLGAKRILMHLTSWGKFLRHPTKISKRFGEGQNIFLNPRRLGFDVLLLSKTPNWGRREF